MQLERQRQTESAGKPNDSDPESTNELLRGKKYKTFLFHPQIYSIRDACDLNGPNIFATS